MVDFDEEAKRILESERKDAASDAKADAGLGQIVLVATCLAFIAVMAVDSVITGHRFSWSAVGFTCAGYAGSVVAYIVNARFKASRLRRDSRLIRIEMKLDRLLEYSEEMEGSRRGSPAKGAASR